MIENLSANYKPLSEAAAFEELKNIAEYMLSACFSGISSKEIIRQSIRRMEIIRSGDILDKEVQDALPNC